MGNGTWAVGAQVNGVWVTWVMGTGDLGHMYNGAYGTIRYRGYGPHGQWEHGAVGYRVWGTVGIGHMDNGAHGAIGYRGMGNRAYGAIGYRGMGYRTYGPHGQWGHMGQ